MFNRVRRRNQPALAEVGHRDPATPVPGSDRDPATPLPGSDRDPATPLPGSDLVAHVSEMLPRMHEALVTLVVHSRQLDDRLAALEQRLSASAFDQRMAALEQRFDDHSIDLSAVAGLATSSDLVGARAEITALGERVESLLQVQLQALTQLSLDRSAPTSVPEARPHYLFASLPLPVPG